MPSITVGRKKAILIGVTWLFLAALTMYLLLNVDDGYQVEAVQATMVGWVGGIVTHIIYKDLVFTKKEKK